MIELILNIILGIFIYVSILYIIATVIRNWSIIDIAWGPGFILIALISLYYSGKVNLAKVLITTMVTLWALRLAWHIGFRNIGAGEDFRYANWRKKWQPFPEIQGYFRVFILQGTIMLIVSLPVIITIAFSDSSYNLFYSFPGIVIFLLGFSIEIIADKQLSSFKKKDHNKGKLIKSGLWTLSRHPNYMGEILLWWGIGIFALPFAYGYIAILGPLCIHLIIRYISIPVLEEKWADRKDWQKIKKEIPILFPFVK